MWGPDIVTAQSQAMKWVWIDIENKRHISQVWIHVIVVFFIKIWFGKAGVKPFKGWERASEHCMESRQWWMLVGTKLTRYIASYICTRTGRQALLHYWSPNFIFCSIFCFVLFETWAWSWPLSQVVFSICFGFCGQKQRVVVHESQSSGGEVFMQVWMKCTFYLRKQWYCWIRDDEMILSSVCESA